MENFHYLIAYVLIIASILISKVENVGLEREIFISSLRTLIQLLALGFILNYILRLNNFWEFILIFAIMSLIASGIFSERTKNFKLFISSFIAINLSYLIPVLFLSFSKVLKLNSYEIIPFGGLIIGNTLNSLSLFYDRVISEIRNRILEIEAKVALGSNLRTAVEDAIKDGIRASMIPKMNWLKSAGIVHIPGVAVGMLVAGESPLRAILFQVVILYTLVFSGLISSVVFSYISYKELFKAGVKL